MRGVYPQEAAQSDEDGEEEHNEYTAPRSFVLVVEGRFETFAARVLPSWGSVDSFISVIDQMLTTQHDCAQSIIEEPRIEMAPVGGLQ
jgi:hypothetical protein